MGRSLRGGAAAVALLVAFAPSAFAQREKKDEEFLKEKPVVGDQLPDLTVYTPDGKEFKTADLRGHYTVLTFGCLT
jgi:cytochrome oxidase Cu insertion factor (SCO1/SenC/PrrC family)